MEFAPNFFGGGALSSVDEEDPVALAASEPKQVTVDGVSVQQHSLTDLIAADKYLKSQAAAKSPSRGLRFTKLVPPGAVSR